MIEMIVAIAAGLIVGSFLNVCICRMPRDLSVSWPGSRCPLCLHPIAWRDNIPLLSFALLGGRCRHCRAAISWRYPLVELFTAALFLIGYLTWGPTLEYLRFAIFATLIIGMIFTDLEARILPDEFTLGGLLLGILLAMIVPVEAGLAGLFLPEEFLRIASALDALLAAAFVSGSLWLVGVLYRRIRHREGLGFGDVKMVAMMGAFLGLSPALLAVLGGCLVGSVVSLVYIYVARKDPSTYELPFGSFLGVAALAVSLFGRGVMHWYWQL